MNVRIELDPSLSERIDVLATRLGTSRSKIVNEALEHGRSIAWQEEWLRRIEAGIAAADRDEFASEDETAALLASYR